MQTVESTPGQGPGPEPGSQAKCEQAPWVAWPYAGTW